MILENKMAKGNAQIRPDGPAVLLTFSGHRFMAFGISLSGPGAEQRWLVLVARRRAGQPASHL